MFFVVKGLIEDNKLEKNHKFTVGSKKIPLGNLVDAATNVRKVYNNAVKAKEVKSKKTNKKVLPAKK